MLQEFAGFMAIFSGISEVFCRFSEISETYWAIPEVLRGFRPTDFETTFRLLLAAELYGDLIRIFNHIIIVSGGFRRDSKHFILITLVNPLTDYACGLNDLHSKEFLELRKLSLICHHLLSKTEGKHLKWLFFFATTLSMLIIPGCLT